MTEQTAISFPAHRIRALRGPSWSMEPKVTDVTVDDATARILALLGDGDWHSQFEVFDLFDGDDVRPQELSIDVIAPLVARGASDERKDYYGSAEVGPNYHGFSHSYRRGPGVAA